MVLWVRIGSLRPMSMLGAGDSHLLFKSEDDNIFPNFRLYARRDDEDDNGFRGHGGGSSTSD